MALATTMWIGMMCGVAAMDATVSDVEGKSISLASCWGKPAVVFYEDKDSTRLNQAFKDRLFSQGRDEGLLAAASVVAIANVKGYNWFPARNFVVKAVHDAEKQFGIPIYLDWDAALSRPPWRLKTAGSTVLVVDRAGSILYARTGELSRAEMDEVVELLRQIVVRP